MPNTEYSTDFAAQVYPLSFAAWAAASHSVFNSRIVVTLDVSTPYTVVVYVESKLAAALSI